MDHGVLLRALVQQGEDLIVVIDAELRVQWVSDRITTMLGYEPGDTIGWNVLDFVHPDDTELAAGNLGAALDGNAPNRSTLVRARQQDGLWCWVDIVGSDLGEVPDLEPARYALYVREVTERQEAERQASRIRAAEERALRRSEERFRSLVLHASDAIVVLNAHGAFEEVNPDRGLFGPRPVEQLLGHNAFDWVHPDDLDLLQQTLVELIDQPGATVTRTFRIIPTQTKIEGNEAFSDHRRWHWIEATATNMLDVANVEGIVINYRDITERVDAQRDAQRLIEVLELADDLIGICDPRGQLLHLNRAGRMFAGLRGGLEKAVVPGQWVTAEDRHRLTHEALDELRRTGRWTGDVHMVDADGNEVATLARLIAHKDDDGEIEFYSWIMRDISDRKAHERRLEHRALHDPLTGLPNRSRLLDGLSQAVREAEAPEIGVAALFVDLDDFKVLNDRRGHATGDELLRKIAARLRDAVRPSDTVSRYGGDEFVVIVEQLTDVSQAVEVAERIRTVLEEPIEVEGEAVVIGASIGIAVTWGLDEDGVPSTPEGLLRAADAAMYEAKRRGRGEVVIAAVVSATHAADDADRDHTDEPDWLPPGIELLASESLSDRLSELTLASAALGRETRVRVLTPAGFGAGDGRALPVLWLLHGGMDDVTSWTERGDAESRTAGLDLLVVMPDAGLGGWYSDWHNAESPAGNLRWESHHVHELRPWIEQRYATRTDRAGRAIAGLSMGGFGAFSYAARHPELFGFAAAFSAALDILDPDVGKTADFTSTTMGARAGDIWGRWPADRSNRRAHNPLDLAANLATLTLELRTGNGGPGGRHGGSDAIEAGIHGPMVRMHERLSELAIDHVWDDYGAGAHDWPYWADDLTATLPGVLAVAGGRLDAPESVTHLAYEPQFSAWEWRVDLDRPCLEPAHLRLSPDGFSLTGSGRGTVTTAATFTPSATVRAHTAGTTWDLAAGADGRVVVTVDLGPPNRVDLDDRDGPVPDPVTVETRLIELS